MALERGSAHLVASDEVEAPAGDGDHPARELVGPGLARVAHNLDSVHILGGVHLRNHIEEVSFYFESDDGIRTGRAELTACFAVHSSCGLELLHPLVRSRECGPSLARFASSGTGSVGGLPEVRGDDEIVRERLRVRVADVGKVVLVARLTRAVRGSLWVRTKLDILVKLSVG